MSKLKTKIYGRKEDLTHSAAHFIGNSLNQFLVAEYPDAVLGSLINLSIGLEILIKKYLEKKNPNLIYLKLEKNKWERTVKPWLLGRKKSQQRAMIISELKLQKLTINFYGAIELLPYYYRVPKEIIVDLHELRGYRNGLFHFEASPESVFSLSKRSIRLYNWIFAFLKREIGWYLGEEFNIIDPDNSKRRLLVKLQESIRNENKFNVQRRIYKCKQEYGICFKQNYHLDQIYSGAKEHPTEECPSCRYKMQVYKGGQQFFIKCLRCDFICSDIEFDAIKPKTVKSLNMI